MYRVKNIKVQRDYKFFILIFIISFSIFIFTAHGHRFTPDEYLAFDQAKRILTQTPDPNFVFDLTRPGLQEPGSIDWSRPPCKDPILCSAIPIGHIVSYMPFIFIEQNLHIIPNFVFTNEDFNDPHYVWWRNSLTHEETFTYLFYGPIITALSTSVLFLICRTYEYSHKTSIMISFLYSFATIVWAYSNTGFNVVLGTLFILCAFLFFKKFKKNNKWIDLIFCGFSLGASILVRYDLAIFVTILFVFLISDIVKKKQKIKNLVNFIFPLIFCGLILMGINFIRFDSFLEFGYGSEEGFFAGHTTPIHVGIFGLLFSPSAGIFVFSPVLLTIFISSFDFYKKNKNDLLIFLVCVISFLFFFGSFHAWHGFVSWGARYMIPIIPFFMLPLGSSLEKRKCNLFRISLLALGIMGVFFNFIWLVQDVSWFVWGPSGGNSGLFSLGIAGMHTLNLNPIVLWTFEYSQLTQAIILAFTDLQVDLFLFHVLGPIPTLSILFLNIIPAILLLRLIRNDGVKSGFKQYETTRPN